MEMNVDRTAGPHPDPLPEGEGTAPTFFMTMIVMLSVCLITGCAKNKHRVGVMERGQNDYMYVQGDGDKEWYSALELAKIAKKYAQEQQLDFPVEESETSIWVYTDDRKLLAEVWFTRGSGEPTLGIEIDRYGRIIRHRMGIGIDRIGADGK